MAIDSEQKRWSMLAMASNPVRTHVFNPATSGLVSIEKITVLQYYGGIAWNDPSADNAFPYHSIKQRRMVMDTMLKTY